MRHGVQVRFDYAVEGGVPIVTAAGSTGGSANTPQLVAIVAQGQHRRSERADILCVTQPTRSGRIDQGAGTWRIGADNRETGGHRFEHDVAERFGDTRAFFDQ